MPAIYQRSCDEEAAGFVEQAGKTREAVVVFQEVLSFAPRHPSARDGLLAAGSGG